MLMTFATVFGLTFLAMLILVLFVAAIKYGSKRYQSGDFFGGMCAMNAAGDVLELFFVVLGAVLQAITDAKS